MRMLGGIGLGWGGIEVGVLFEEEPHRLKGGARYMRRCFCFVFRIV